jgi:polyhydroxyalkanoate synthase
VLSTTFRVAGGLPAWAVRASFKATALQREITKPWFVLRNLHDADTLGRMEAVDRFIGLMPGYPGRLYGRLYDEIVQRNTLNDGYFELSGERTLRLANVSQDVLVVGGTTDVIAPVACVERALDVLTGARSIRFETAPGSHLGVLTGPEARDTTWRYIAEFLAGVAAPAEPVEQPSPAPTPAADPPSAKPRRRLPSWATRSRAPHSRGLPTGDRRGSRDPSG